MADPAQVYLDRGDRMAGRFSPPRPCRIITSYRCRGGPRNVAVTYLDDGSRQVIPMGARRLRKAAGHG